jgi:hypothetical protein
VSTLDPEKKQTPYPFFNHPHLILTARTTSTVHHTTCTPDQLPVGLAPPAVMMQPPATPHLPRLRPPQPLKQPASHRRRPQLLRLRQGVTADHNHPRRRPGPPPPSWPQPPAPPIPNYGAKRIPPLTNSPHAADQLPARRRPAPRTSPASSPHVADQVPQIKPVSSPCIAGQFTRMTQARLLACSRTGSPRPPSRFPSAAGQFPCSRYVLSLTRTPHLCLGVLLSNMKNCLLPKFFFSVGRSCTSPLPLFLS